MSMFIGRIVGTKMQKTAKVEVYRMVLHPHVLKVSQHYTGKLKFSKGGCGLWGGGVKLEFC